MRIRYVATVLFVGVLTQGVRADDWPQWLGPKRDAVWREDGLVKELPKSELKVKWRQDVSGGYSGPSVAEGKVFVTDFVPSDLKKLKVPKKTNPWTRVTIPGRERLLCFRESDGKPLWSHEYSRSYTMAYEYANGPRAVPTVHDGLVYFLGAEGDFTCLDAETGDVRWSKFFPRDYSAKTPVWGWSSHPLIDGDLVITVVGGQGSTAVAWNRKTGQEVWRSLSSKEPGYAAPVIYELGGLRQLIIWHGEAVNGIDPADGKPFWSVEAKPFSGMSCSTPRAWNDHLYVMGYQHMSAMLRVAKGGKSASVLWRGKPKSGIAGTMNTAHFSDGVIYGDGASGRYTCASVETGEWRWHSYEPSTGSRPVRWANVFTVRLESAGPNRYVLANDQGDLIFATLTPESYQETSRAKIVEPSHRVWGRLVAWSHPAFANRCVYQRNDREIVCYSLAAHSEKAESTPSEEK
ncbi:MAG: PQQ-binding-like beta-propeller repeat protein [Planctomycetota bacterium]